VPRACLDHKLNKRWTVSGIFKDFQCAIQAECGREDAKMEICNDFSSRQHPPLHCCHNYTKHRGLEAGYCLMSIYCCVILLVVITFCQYCSYFEDRSYLIFFLARVSFCVFKITTLSQLSAVNCFNKRQV